MAFDLDNEELRATRKLHGQDDGLYEDKSDKNVASVEDLKVLKSIVKVHNDFLKGSGKETISEREIQAIEHILSEREQDKERIKELEEKNKKLVQKNFMLDKVIEYCKRFEYETEPIQDDDYLTERALVCGDILEILEGEK